MKTLCDTCQHDMPNKDCEYACTGVTGRDEINEVVTSCQDYREGHYKSRGTAISVPKYAQEIAARSHFGGFNHPKCSPGYTLKIRKATPYTYADTFRSELERLCAWARKHYAEAEILEAPTETRHNFQYALVTITDPVMKYLEKYILEEDEK